MNEMHRLPYLERVRRWLFIASGVALAGFAAGAIRWPAQSFRSYLLAFIFWLGPPLGSQMILMLHHLVGGAWGMAIRPLLQCSAATIPLLVLLFIPLLFGLHH